VVERNRPDFRDLLAGAAVSVSQAGYNTMLDVLAARVPAVLVPFADGNQSEQTFRAARLAAMGFAVALPEAELTPTRLLDAVHRALTLPPPETTFDLRGAETSAGFVLARLAARRAEVG
jgi:predicted glycosyltransferase